MAAVQIVASVFGSGYARKRLSKSVLFTVALAATIVFPTFLDGLDFAQNPADIMRSPPIIFPSNVNLGIYRELFGDPPQGADSVDGLRYMKNSLTLGLGTMVLTIVFAIPAAYGLARFQLRGSRRS